MLVTWAKTKYRRAFDGVSVADIQYKGSRAKSESGQRSFRPDELDKLFKCQMMEKYCNDGSQVHKFWLPVIGLYTGMRVNEICQINPFTDILEKDGTWYFWINDETEGADGVVKSVKNGMAREVPIHSKLIELGLLEYVDELKNKGYKRMFPHDSVNNKAGDNTARNFRRYLESVLLRDESKNKKILGMHAFRKTIVTQAFKNEFINDLLCIIGHEEDVRDESGKLLPNVTKLYIDNDALEVPLSVKKETIEKVKFDIDFYKPAKPIFNCIRSDSI